MRLMKKIIENHQKAPTQERKHEVRHKFGSTSFSYKNPRRCFPLLWQRRPAKPVDLEGHISIPLIHGITAFTNSLEPNIQWPFFRTQKFQYVSFCFSTGLQTSLQLQIPFRLFKSIGLWMPCTLWMLWISSGCCAYWSGCLRTCDQEKIHPCSPYKTHPSVTPIGVTHGKFFSNKRYRC